MLPKRQNRNQQAKRRHECEQPTLVSTLLVGIQTVIASVENVTSPSHAIPRVEYGKYEISASHFFSFYFEVFSNL